MKIHCLISLTITYLSVSHFQTTNHIRGFKACACACEQDLNAPNEEKNTPLHWACLNGHVEVNNVFVQ